MTTMDEQLRTLRRAGYKPYARMRIMGRDLELISLPFPKDDGTIGCMVREPDDPTTMEEWTVPAHVLRLAAESFGTAEPTHPLTGEPSNAARAARVEDAIRAYAVRCYGLQADQEDMDTVVQDFLSDVYHFAARAGLTVDDVSGRAYRMFQEECADEKGDSCEFTQQNPHEWFCTTHQLLCIGSTQEPVSCPKGRAL